MNSLVELLVYLLVSALIIYVVFFILGMLAIDARLKQVLLVVVSFVVIIWLVLTFLPRFMP